MSNKDAKDIEDEQNWKTKIHAAFDLFDKDKKGVIVQEEVSTIMRYLGFYPSEKDIIKKILPDMQEDEPTAFVTYEKFEKKMLEVHYGNEYQPDTHDTLLTAFQVLDPQKNGYIEENTMRELLMTKGTPFREKELEGFLSVAKDLDTGRIYYEDYIAILMGELEAKQ